MTQFTAFGRVTPDGLVVDYWGWQVTCTIPGSTWLVHRAGQRPVEGVAVYRYTWGYRCERDGATPCCHLDSVLRQVPQDNERAERMFP